jgi:hypothetical protein
MKNENDQWNRPPDQLDGVYGKDVCTIAYRIDFCEKRKYKLKIVSIISQGGNDAEVLFPYEIVEQ